MINQEPTQEAQPSVEDEVQCSIQMLEKQMQDLQSQIIKLKKEEVKREELKEDREFESVIN